MGPRMVAVLIGTVLVGTGLLGSGAAQTSQDEWSQNGLFHAAGQDRGVQIYRELCAVCHGDSGRGDGPLAFGMRPTVLDLRFHMAEGHTDQDFYTWISDGIPGVPLHAFGSELTEQDRWDIINYIRSSFTE